jgi:hypothetical protein
MSLRTGSWGTRCRWLAAAIAGLWLIAIVPARHFFGVAGIEAASISAISCLLGGFVTFWLVARQTQPRIQAFAVLYGTGIRGFFALVGALIMRFLLNFPDDMYLIWLGFFYLASLGLETVLMVNVPDVSEDRSQSSG